MSQLTYLLMGATLPIVDHLHISDAGAFGQQTQTPLVDIAYLHGGLQSANPLVKRVELPTGSVSPIVPIRAMLKSLQDQPEVLYADLGTGHPFDPMTDSPDPLVTKVFRQKSPATSNNQFPPLKGCYYASVDNAMEFSMQFMSYLVQERRTPDETIIIAECVPGGTSTAALLISALTGELQTTPSSSVDQDVKARKHTLVAEALSKYNQAKAEGQDISPLALCDAFQLSLFYLLSGLPNYLNNNSHLKARKIILGGGSQMVSVVQLLKYMLPETEWWSLAQHLLIATTPWCAKKMGLYYKKNSAILRQENKDIYPVKIAAPTFDFQRSRLKPLYLYEKGYTVEGCGLGAVMFYMQYEVGVSPTLSVFSIEYQMYKEGFKEAQGLFPEITFTNTANQP